MRLSDRCIGRSTAQLSSCFASYLSVRSRRRSAMASDAGLWFTGCLQPYRVGYVVLCRVQSLMCDGLSIIHEKSLQLSQSTDSCVHRFAEGSKRCVLLHG